MMQFSLEFKVEIVKITLEQAFVPSVGKINSHLYSYFFLRERNKFFREENGRDKKIKYENICA